MTKGPAFRRWFISPGAREAADLSPPLRAYLEDLPEELEPSVEQDLVVTTAQDVLWGSGLPKWIGLETRYLILMDVPEPAILRLPTVLGLYKPDQRMHVTRDVGVVKRVLLSLARDEGWEAVLDAYVLRDRLVVVLGDFRIAEFPSGRIPCLGEQGGPSLSEFVIDSSGSFLYWPSLDLHLGASQLLQAVDPMHLADIEIRRYATTKVSTALLTIREEAGLRQSDIDGLSERQVRRLEKEESRFTAEAARSYASALGCSLDEFLGHLSRRITELRDPAEDDLEDSQNASTTDNTGPPARAATGGPRPNRPNVAGVRPQR
jgi:transcriptional regulator with XRE-family HTH domain